MEQKIETKEQALNVLIQVAQKAQSNGILSLSEAVLVADSIKMFSTQEVEEGESKEEK